MTDRQTAAGGGGDSRADKQLPLTPGSPRAANQHPRVADVNDLLPHPVGPKNRTLASWWARILDGRHEWGSVEVSPPRYGVTRYRLVVFPPGIDTVERRLLRSWRAWPTWGALLWVATQIILSAFQTPGAAFAVSTIAYLGAGMILFARVATLRTRVRTLVVVRMAGYPDQHSAAMCAELKALVTALLLADVERDEGRLSPTAHEAVWWEVYDRVGQAYPGRSEDPAPQ